MSEFTKHYDGFRNARHIIIDDAQSMRQSDYGNWYEAAKNIIKRNNRTSEGDLEIGFLWVFLDMSQKENIFPTGLPTLEQQKEQNIHVLDKVVRNPISVYETSKYFQKFCEGSQCWESKDVEQFYHNRVFPGTKVSHSYEGEVVNHFVLSGDQSSGQVADKVKEITDGHLQEGGKLGDIAVLVSTISDAESLQHRLQQTTSYGSNISSAGQAGLKSSLSFAGYPEVNECLIVDSVRRFAGLERPVIISACVSVKCTDKYSNTNRLKYLAITRAMSKAHIVDFEDM